MLWVIQAWPNRSLGEGKIMKILDVASAPFHTLYFRSSGRKGKPESRFLPFYHVTVSGLPDTLPAVVVSADLQGRESGGKKRLLGLAVAEELAALQKGKVIAKVGLVVLAGDLYDVPGCDSRGGTGEVTKVWNGFAKHFPFVTGVHGNHDIVSAEKLRDNVRILDGDCFTYEGLKLGGVCGVIGRIDRNQRKTQKDFMASLGKVTQKAVDLVVLHEGPDDLVSGQRGNPVIREFFEKKKTGFLVFGHSFWEQPFQTIGKNQVLNTDSKVFILQNATGAKKG